MAYQPYDRNASGIVFFGTSATDQVFESSSNFVVDAANSQVRVPNIVVSDGGKIGSASQTGILTLASDGVATFSSGVVIEGNLTVNGTQVVLNTETLNVEDNIIILNSNATGSASTDAGVEVERGDDTNVRLQWDEGENQWSFTNNGSNYHPMGVARSGLSYDSTAGNKYYFDIGAGNGITVNANDIAVTAGTGITVNSEGVNVDITGLTELTTSANDDVLLIYDTDASTHKKITKSNLLTDLGGGTVTSVAISGTDGIDVDSGSPITTTGVIVLGLSNVPNAALANSSITVAGDAGSNQTLSLGDTLTISGGSGIVTYGANTDTLTIDLNVDNSTIEVATDIVQIKDSGVTSAKIADSAVTEVKRSRTVDSSFSNNDTISSDINLVSGGAGGIAVKLPTPVSGKIVVVKKIDSAAGTVTIQQNNTDTIDGASSKSLYYQYETMTFVSDGTNWFII
ncbi:MAG: hypothetical protein VKK63_11435 [Synechococcus sp.]|nr:hypothetical protein [Synechococcus sp.]